MKLKKFRIKNYKSIIDSGDCYLTDTITILAGKNESGKTSILEALEDFGTEKKIRAEAKSIKPQDKNPEISISFILQKDTANEILDKIESPVKATSDIELEIIKSFPDQYSFGEDTLKNEIFDDKEIEKIKKSIKDKWDKLKAIGAQNKSLEASLLDLDLSSLVNAQKIFADFKNTVTPNIQNIDEKVRDNFLQLLSEVEAEINNLENLFIAEKMFLKSLKQYIPNFILFSSFEDITPNKIPFGELENNEFIRDLSVISDLKIETITGTDDRGKAKHKDDLNIKLNKDYERFWTQDVSDLSVDWDSQNLFFWVKEDGFSYEPSLRGKGRQWHLAFYIKVSARANENVPNIILIDEPGLFLHAKAQKDILGKLEDSAKKGQLIFSTHSPYLLEADKLDRVRLIHKTKESGTKIENKIHALADKETLTPILTAIGFEMTAGISALDKMNNVVVEGPSDVYYLNAFKKILNKNSMNFIFGGGAGNMPFVGTILHGWGAKVVYLFDNDQGKKDGEKNLKRNWLVLKDLILSILDEEDVERSIEDIFSPPDFKKFVLEDESKTYSESNSEYVKKNKLDKVLLAKQFLETCQNENSINLDETTKGNINKLFEDIECKFSPTKNSNNAPEKEKELPT